MYKGKQVCLKKEKYFMFLTRLAGSLRETKKGIKHSSLS